MNPLIALRARLKARTDSEHEQAILRIVIGSVVLADVGAVGGHAEPQLVLGLTGYLVLVIGLFVAICVWPAPNIPRRITGMLADIGTATFCMFFAGEYGAVVIGVYLFITFGNGFRYGRSYLFASQALCILGFFAVLLYAPYWRYHQTEGWALIIALVVLPIYVSTLLKRIVAEKAQAEQALKECLERQGRSI